MKKTLHPSDVSAVCDGQIFLDCSIRSQSLVYILARTDLSEDDAVGMDDKEISTRVLLLQEVDDDDALLVAANEFDDLAWPKLGVSQKPLSQGLLVAGDQNGTVIPMGGGKPFWPPELLEKNRFPQCKRMRCIDGYTWAVGIDRGVFKRLDIGKWQKITQGFDVEKPNDNSGFNDIDGFSEREIYAVGGKGDIWKYTGQQWERCGFPTNDSLYTVCCAKNGFVYVGTRNALWKGKGNQWEKVCHFEYPDKMKDLRWFDNKLWLAYDYRLQMWDGNQLHDDIIYNGKKLSLSAPIDSSDDMLLVAGSYEAWTYDGNDWYNIIPKFN